MIRDELSLNASGTNRGVAPRQAISLADDQSFPPNAKMKDHPAKRVHVLYTALSSISKSLRKTR